MSRMTEQSHIADENAKNSSKFITGPPDPFYFSFCVEQKPGNGEDSEPIVSVASARNSGLIGVFDGMGGAGGTVHADRGINRTGAYIASRLASASVSSFFNNSDLTPQFTKNLSTTKSVAQHLCKWLIEAFKTEAIRLEQSPTRLAGTMIRHLPTTMACTYFETADNVTTTYSTFWAGDSRAYLLSPIDGLQQISIDDLKSGGDALQNLTDDSPISNCINAEGDFTVNCHCGYVRLPIVYIVATDGCFNFAPSPSHFEYSILETLSQSHSSLEWAERLRNQLFSIAGDDLSIALVALGWTQFTTLQAAFAVRKETLWKTYIKPIDDLEYLIQKSAEEHKRSVQDRDQLRLRLWNEYKKKYELLQQQHVNIRKA